MKDIFKEMEQLRAKLDELSAYAEKECSKPKMFPQKGDEYWLYNAYGVVTKNTCFDHTGRLNVFRTEEEAKKAIEIAFSESRLKHAIEIANDGWIPDFNDSCENKHYFYRDGSLFPMATTSSVKTQPKWMYMKSRTIASKILAKHIADLSLILGE